MKQVNENITLRVTKKSISVINQIDKIAQAKAENFGATMLDCLKIGLKFYEDGYRVVEDELVKLPSKTRSVYSIDNEVAESLYSSLAGLLADMGRCGKEKSSPDKHKLDYYELIRGALWNEKRKFYTFSDEEISSKAAALAPILKSMVIADDYETRSNIVADNHKYFDELIKRAGV
jgi:hypothetical protein